LHTLDLKCWPKKIERRRKKYNVQNLQISSVREEFKLELKNGFGYYHPGMRIQTLK